MTPIRISPVAELAAGQLEKGFFEPGRLGFEVDDVEAEAAGRGEDLAAGAVARQGELQQGPVLLEARRVVVEQRGDLCERGAEPEQQGARTDPPHQGGGAVEGDDLAVVHDRDALAHRLRLLEVVGGQQHRGPLAVDFPHELPQGVAQLHVDPGGRLVEDQQARLVDQGLGHHQASLQAAGELVHRLLQVRTEIEALDQQLAPGLVGGVAVVAGVEAQGVVDVEKVVDHDLLVHDADQAAGEAVVAAVVVAEDADLPGVDAGDAGDHVDGGALAGPVGAEQAEDFALLDEERDVVDGFVRGVALGEVADIEGGSHEANYRPPLLGRQAPQGLSSDAAASVSARSLSSRRLPNRRATTMPTS